MSVSPAASSGITALTFSGAEKLAINSGFTMSDGTMASYTRDVSGRVHGLVTLQTTASTTRSLWLNGMPHGKTEIIEEGKKTTYSRVGDKQIGPMVVVLDDGTKITYPCDEQGNKTGKGSVEYPEGTHQAVNFVDGKPQGTSVLSRDKVTITFIFKEDGTPRWGGEIKKEKDRSAHTIPTPQYHENFQSADVYYRFYIDKLSENPQLTAPERR